MRVDIHDFQRRLERRIELINSSNRILKPNKKLLIKFYHSCTAEGLGIPRIEKCLYHLCHIASMLKKNFNECVKEDIAKLVEVIERKDCSDWTKHDYKVILKKFFRWLRGTEEYPDEVKWIKANNVKNNNLPEELLTDEEIKRMANFAQNPRDKALVLVLYESGCRIGELLTLRIKHVEFDDYGAVLLVSGKTGSRRVRIIASAPSLSAMLDNHPFKNNPTAPLWIVLGTRNHHEIMSYASVSSLLRRLAKRAGVKKRVNPHSFRHSRATHLASKLTEAQLKELFGWVQSSDMAATYVHLSGRDVDDALLKLHGLAQNEKKEEEVLKVKICERCKEKNDPVSNFCRRCATPLNIKIALDLEEKRTEKDEVVAMVTERVYQKLQKLVAEKLNIDVEDVVYETIKEMRLVEKFEKL